MKQKLLFTLIISFTITNLFSQIKLSSDYYESGSWDKTEKEWSFYYANNEDTTIFEIDEELKKIKLSRGNIITSYKIKGIEKEDENTTSYTVTCITCNDIHKKIVEKLTITVALKKNFIGIYTYTTKSSPSLTRYLIAQ